MKTLRLIGARSIAAKIRAQAREDVREMVGSHIGYDEISCPSNAPVEILPDGEGAWVTVRIFTHIEGGEVLNGK